MPFSDSNVRKMMCTQKWYKTDFHASKYLTKDCEDLIFHLLQPDTSQRLYVNEVFEILVVPNSKIPNPYPLCPLHKRVSVPKNCRGKAWAWSASQNFFLRDGKVGWRKSDSLKNWSSLWTAGFQLQLPPALSEIIIFCFTKFIYWAEWTTISDMVCNNQEFWSKAQRKAFFWVTVLFTLKLLLHQLQNTISKIAGY